MKAADPRRSWLERHTHEANDDLVFVPTFGPVYAALYLVKSRIKLYVFLLIVAVFDNEQSGFFMPKMVG